MSYYNTFAKIEMRLEKHFLKQKNVNERPTSAPKWDELWDCTPRIRCFLSDSSHRKMSVKIGEGIDIKHLFYSFSP